MKLSDIQITSTFGWIAAILTILTALAFGGALTIAQWKGTPLDPTYLPWASRWLDFLQWLIPAVFLAVVGKRATAKADVIDAETRQAVVTGSVPPPTPKGAP